MRYPQQDPLSPPARSTMIAVTRERIFIANWHSKSVEIITHETRDPLDSPDYNIIIVKHRLVTRTGRGRNNCNSVSRYRVQDAGPKLVPQVSAAAAATSYRTMITNNQTNKR